MIGKITPEVIHDINNHLTGILGYAELLSMKKIEDESIKKGLKNISFSAEKCKDIAGQYLVLVPSGIIRCSFWGCQRDYRKNHRTAKMCLAPPTN